MILAFLKTTLRLPIFNKPVVIAHMFTTKDDGRINAVSKNTNRFEKKTLSKDENQDKIYHSESRKFITKKFAKNQRRDSFKSTYWSKEPIKYGKNESFKRRTNKYTRVDIDHSTNAGNQRFENDEETKKYSQKRGQNKYNRENHDGRFLKDKKDSFDDNVRTKDNFIDHTKNNTRLNKLYKGEEDEIDFKPLSGVLKDYKGNENKNMESEDILSLRDYSEDYTEDKQKLIDNEEKLIKRKYKDTNKTYNEQEHELEKRDQGSELKGKSKARRNKKDLSKIQKAHSETALIKPPESRPLSINPTKQELHMKIPEVMISALGSEEYRKSATPEALINVLRALAYHTQEHPFIKQRPEIKEAIQFLCHPMKLRDLNNKSISLFLSSLVTNRIQDQKIWAPVAAELLRRRKEFTLDEIAFIMLSMKNSNEFLSVIMNNDGFFFDMEEEIILKFNQGEFNQNAATKILKAYSQSENGSIDFYRLMEKKLVENANRINRKNLSTILFTLSEVENCDNELFKDFKEVVGRIIKGDKFDPVELCKVLKAFNIRKILDEELLKDAEICVLSKHEIFKMPEIAAIYKIFVNNKTIYDPVKAWKYINKCVRELYKSLEIKGIADLFENWNGADCALDLKSKSNLKHQVLRLIKTKDRVSKQELIRIYKIVKEEKVEPGKYNTFAEKIYMEIRDYI